MKKIIVYINLLVILLFIQDSWAQDSFTKFDNSKQVNSYLVNKKMFDMMSNVQIDPSNTKEKAYYDVVKNLNNLRVYSTKDSDVKSQMKDAVNQYVSKQNLKLHSSKKSEQAIITIYLNQDGNDKQFSDYLLFSESTLPNKEHIIFVIQGKLNNSDISTLIQKMDLPIKDLIQ